MASLSTTLRAKLSDLLKEDIKDSVKLTQQQQQQGQSSFSEQSSNLAKIQKVQPYLRKRPEFAKYYFPKLVSIGPIHRLKDDCRTMNLEEGEKYKKMWASMYLKEKVREPIELLEIIRSKIQTLKGFYTEDAIRGFVDDDGDELAWIFFVDGCAVLQIMNKATVKNNKLEALDIIVQHDLLLLENQLPYQVLKILNYGHDATLRSYVERFLQMHHMIPQPQSTDLSKKQQRQPTHLLDLLRTTILAVDDDEEQKDKPKEVHDDSHQKEENFPAHKKKEHEDDEQKEHLIENLPTHRNIKELRTSGIGIKPNDPGECLTRIQFRRSNIYLSKLIVDDFTAQTFLNMTAYEMCPDFKNKYEISNYLFFLNSLIDHEDDVKEMRKAGVLNNFLGSDQEVANIFNTVSTDLVLDTGIYDSVRKEIEKHYKRKIMTWLTELRHKHFNSPWAFIGLLSTLLGLTLAIINLRKVFT